MTDNAPLSTEPKDVQNAPPTETVKPETVKPETVKTEASSKKRSEPNPEKERLESIVDNPETWRLWGPYLSERAWGTVREDYSADGSAWEYFPHEHARSRAYRWNEDGIAGISDIRQFLCFALAFWNGKDSILKERLFGLTGNEGNHAEDPKELYFYTDATPTASYLEFIYWYPQKEYPYAELLAEAKRRTVLDPENELWDTGVFNENRYFTIKVEYAKADWNDISIKITAKNNGPDPAPLWLLPNLWFRNTWSWDQKAKPTLFARQDNIYADHPRLGTYVLECQDAETRLFTENETNYTHLFNSPNISPYVKDAFHRFLIEKEIGAVNPKQQGTKACAVYQKVLAPQEEWVVTLRFATLTQPLPTSDANLFSLRKKEADTFYARFIHPDVSEDAKQIQREAYAGLIWSKQFYHFNVDRWLNGDVNQPPMPKSRRQGRNAHWKTLHAADILSMPDTWEYPWFAAWDLAFHMIPFAQIDPDFAKYQMRLLGREWYMHPNGQLPAYEWAFSDVNPPVHAWAALRLYKIERKQQGKGRDEPGDVAFLKKIFNKLLINFTWWVNQKDIYGNNLFEGGFLGMDNIGVFNRSGGLPPGGTMEQADGTAWMAMYALNMLAIALELCQVDKTYDDVATKFAEHFIYIAHALTQMGEENEPLWDEEDGFFYDRLHLPDGTTHPLKVRSVVGLIPLFAVEVFNEHALANVPKFTERLNWFLQNKPDLVGQNTTILGEGQRQRVIFSLVGKDRLRRILTRILDTEEFLSPHGIRAVSKYHLKNPYSFSGNTVSYDPAESTSRLYGGNSNWRGPLWFPINYLFIESLQKYDYAYGTSFMIDCPTGSGQEKDLWGVASDLSTRLSQLFLRDENGKRACFGGVDLLQNQPHLLFHEYFHGDNGAGLGAMHQTGWTALIAKLLAQNAPG